MRRLAVDSLFWVQEPLPQSGCDLRVNGQSAGLPGRVAPAGPARLRLQSRAEHTHVADPARSSPIVARRFIQGITGGVDCNASLRQPMTPRTGRCVTSAGGGKVVGPQAPSILPGFISGSRAVECGGLVRRLRAPVYRPPVSVCRRRTRGRGTSTRGATGDLASGSAGNRPPRTP
jgi:hypothetical protein